MLIGSPSGANAANTSNRDDARDRRRQRAAAQPQQRQHAAERRAEQHRRAQDLADAPRDVLGHVRDPVMRPSVEAVWRVFVSDHSGLPVTSRSLSEPHERRRGREQRQPEHLTARATPDAPRPAVSRSAAAGRVEHIQPVQAREDPRLRSQQPGQREQRQHRRARAAAAVTRRAARRARAAGTGCRRRRARRRRAPARASGTAAPRARRPARGTSARRGGRSPSRTPTARGSRARPTTSVRRRAGRAAQRITPSSSSSGCGVGAIAHVVRGRLPARELPAPGERVERVVVDEADAADQAQRRAPPTSDHGARGEPAAMRSLTGRRHRADAIRSRGGRSPSAGAGRAWIDSAERCRQRSSHSSSSGRCTAGTARARSPTSSARSPSCGRCATRSSAARSTTPTCSSARAAPARRRWRRSSPPA